MTASLDQRLTITIPFPMAIPRQRGIHAVNKSVGKVICDFTVDEINLLSEGAAKAGIKKAQFIRWVVTMAAKEVCNVPEPVQSVPPV